MDRKDRQAYAKEFLSETIEAFVIILLFQLISETKISFQGILRTFKFGVLVGVLSTITFAIDQTSHEKIKDGMRSAVGASVVATALGIRR